MPFDKTSKSKLKTVSAKGGKSSSAKLTPKERAERARKAAEARWSRGR